MKRNKIIVAGILMFLMFLGIGFNIKAEEEIIYQTPQEFKTISCNHNSMYNSDTTYTEYAYRDEMLLSHLGKQELSPDLAVVSAALAMTAYNQENVADCLDEMGYTVVSTSKWYYTQTTYTDNDHVAYTIGNKKVEYNGKVYNMYVIPVRGTPATSEWYSNFNVGTGALHLGFYAAANEVIADFESVLDESYGPAQTIIWVMGHSRGAAVANIISAKLSVEKGYTLMGNVFGYTYACPNVNVYANTDMKNIYNFNNPGDPVTAIPLESWGFKRFGQTIALPESDYANLKQRYKAVTGKEYNVSLSTDGFADLLESIAPTLEAYNQPDTQCLIDIVAYFLGGKDDTNSGHNALTFMAKHSKAPKSMILSLGGLAGQTMLASFKIGLDSYILDEVQFLGEIDRAIDETDAYTDEEWLSWSSYQGSFLGKIKENLDVEVRSKEDLRRARNVQLAKIDDSSTLIGDIENVCYLFWDTNGDPVSSFMQGHAQETYVLWLNSMYYGYRGWYRNDDILEVVIDEKITYLGNDCFVQSSVEKIVFPDTLKMIGNYACSNCDYLKEIVIQDGTRRAGNSAFYACGALEKVTMPIDMEYIWEWHPSGATFQYTEGVREIVYTVGETGEMGDKPSDAYHYSLEGFSSGSLEKISYEEGITRIGDYANASCGKLKEVVLPESLKEVGDSAFMSCAQMELSELPARLEKVGAYGFANSGLSCEYVNIPQLEEGSLMGTNIRSIEFGEAVKEIASGVCRNCKSLEEIVIHNNVRKAGPGAFYACDSLRKVTMPIDMEYIWEWHGDGATFYETRGVQEIVYTVGETGVMGDKPSDMHHYSLEGFSSDSLEKISYEEGITKIGAYANISCGKLKEVVLPKSLKEVGNFAFSGCVQVTLLELSPQLEKLGESCFSGTGIITINFGEKLTEIPREVCSNCFSLEEIVIDNNVRKAGPGAFEECDSLRKVTMPIDMEYIWEWHGDGATFQYTEGVREIVYTVGENGEMGDKPSDTYHYSLEGFSSGSLEKVSYEEGITKIGAYANSNCGKLKEVVLPESLKEVGDSAFMGCAQMELSELPACLEKVGAYGFANSGLSCEYVNIPQLEEGSFMGTNIRSIEFSEAVQEIAPGVCRNCKSLEEIVIHNNVRKAGPGAFYACDSLRKVTMPIDMEYIWEWHGDGATFYDTRGVQEIVYTVGETGEMGDKPSDMHHYSLEGFSNGSLEKISYEEGITKIGAYANISCGNLKSVLIPGSIEEIADNAFDGCPSDLVVYGIKDSMGEDFASQKHYQFIPLNYPIISFESETVDRGSLQQFSALVYIGIEETNSDVDWSISGNQSKNTKIDAEGLLNVAPDESADAITIIASVGENESSILISLEGEIQKPQELVTEVFSDIEENQWYVDEVQYVYDHKIMKGYDTLFKPEEAVSRAMVVQTLYKLEQEPEVTDFEKYDTLTDLTRNDWWKNSVAWGMNHGIVKGYTDIMKFKPEDSVTREELATFLYRYIKMKNPDVKLDKTPDEILGDTQVNSWGKEAFAWAIENEIIKGISKTNPDGSKYYDYSPETGATRAQLATILQRICEGDDL